ncbi:AsnC family protein [Bosea sp. 685]|uniref:AsnC family protein n=1 Tax=Bosea sp. 685 TaxID=3080057 RepID=UPI00289310F9|nr:AsnC family protein [Bosea sp. 685]WNJ90857.1 AsnC family protein [Bosea sp. 685]
MPDHKLDDIDRRIVHALQADGRMGIQDLAGKAGISPITWAAASGPAAAGASS